MNDLLEALKHPEYIHVLLNPIAGYVLLAGLALLLMALLRKKLEMQTAALWVLVFVGVTAWPTWYFGHQAYAHLMMSLTEEAKQWANVHVQRADRFVYSLYLTGALALAALVLPRKFPKTATPLAISALIAGLIASGLVGWIARPGGKIRHSEFRTGPPPAAPAHKHTQGGEHSH